MRKVLLASIALAGLYSGSASAAAIVAASLFSPLPPVGNSFTPVSIQGVVPPSNTTYNGNGFTITFATDNNQGIVQGTIANVHAVPVAGVTMNGDPTYLTGDFGSAQTTNVDASGNYLSTGLGVITITFDTPQNSLALLWGSIDRRNSLSFNDAAGDTVTGVEAQAAAAGFVSNGFQGPGGSAYVVVTTDTSFTTVTLTSGIVSFEAAAIAGSFGQFSVPEPASMALLGTGLVGAGLVRRRRNRK